MDKMTIFFVVFLYACLRGLLQRRHVREELERRMEEARNRTSSRPLIPLTPTPKPETPRNESPRVSGTDTDPSRSDDQHGQID